MQTAGVAFGVEERGVPAGFRGKRLLLRETDPCQRIDAGHDGVRHHDKNAIGVAAAYVHFFDNGGIQVVVADIVVKMVVNIQ